MPIDLRPTADTDADDLLTMWLALGAEGHAADSRYCLRDDAAETARILIATQWLSDDDHRVAVAASGDRLVGFTTARLSPPHPILQTPGTVVITDAYVAPAHRRAGVGRGLLEHLVDWATDQSAEQLEVGTLALDQRAVAFWRSAGFGDWRITLAHPVPG